MVDQKPQTLTILGDPAAAVCEDEFCVIPGTGVAANEDAAAS